MPLWIIQVFKTQALADNRFKTYNDILIAKSNALGWPNRLRSHTSEGPNEPDPDNTGVGTGRAKQAM